MDQLKEDLKAKREEISKVEERIETLNREIEALYEEEIRIITFEKSGKFLREDVVRYRKDLQKLREELKKELAVLHEQENEILARLRTKMREKKIMENLKSRSLQEHLQEQRRKEAVFIDEIALQKFIRENIRRTPS
ncbi:MAG: Flagellar FliJ protein [Thermotogota bacterium]|nr:Flagellar FliJ protein [Thermotogota bacterium]MDK2865025.1 Flagellar FliJ protein [Thermotogota bacterium]